MLDINRMKIALGTKNQAKREAVTLATGVEPICLAVPSGVSDQPLSEHETIEGAVHRAKTALEKTPEAAIGLGLEGGLSYDEAYTGQWHLISICAAWNGEQLSVGKGLSFPIPRQIGERVKREGIELRHIIDDLSGVTGSNHRGGAYALLTDGRIKRAEVFRDAVIAALTPLVSKLYQD